MKKKIFLMFALLVGMVSANATNEVVVGDVTIPQGGTGVVNIELNNDDYEFTAYQLKLILPEGLNFVANNKGKPSFVAGDRYDDHSISSETSGMFTCASFSLAPISGTNGVLLSVNLAASAEVEVGTTLSVTLGEMEFTTTGASPEPVKFDNVTFYVTIGEPADTRTILDENSTTAPAAATGVDVRVKRSIKADEWSTLCLPFAMTSSQVTAAFGEDVQLADFTSWTSEEDGETGDIVSIEIGFTAISTIAANHPCLIKVSKAIEEFTVDGVDIDPEDDPSIKVGRNKATRGFFTGTYVAGTAVPENNLFLFGNKFWYSTGLTTTKAFRGYFELADVLTSVEEGAGTKVRFSIDGETTAIRSIENGEQRINNEDGIYYTLDGRKLNGKPMEKGMYIVNGKKVLKK